MEAQQAPAACRYGQPPAATHLPWTSVQEATQPPPPGPRLLDLLREEARARNFSERTAQAYAAWVRRFVLYHGKRHPLDMGEPEIARFLSHLAAGRRLSAATQAQARSALRFLYRHVLRKETGVHVPFVRGQRVHRPPAVLTREEVRAVLDRLHGQPRLMADLMYGAGLRLMECCRLQVMDVDLDRALISIRGGDGNKDRTARIPGAIRDLLRRHLVSVRRLFEDDLRRGGGWAGLPAGRGAGHTETARLWGRQWVFPATRTLRDPATGQRRRHHYHQSALQRSVKEAMILAGITKPASCNSIRHSLALHLIDDGHDVETVRRILGLTDAGTTFLYAHALRRARAPIAMAPDPPPTPTQTRPAKADRAEPADQHQAGMEPASQRQINQATTDDEDEAGG